MDCECNAWVKSKQNTLSIWAKCSCLHLHLRLTHLCCANWVIQLFFNGKYVIWHDCEMWEKTSVSSVGLCNQLKIFFSHSNCFFVSFFILFEKKMLAFEYIVCNSLDTNTTHNFNWVNVILRYVWRFEIAFHMHSEENDKQKVMIFDTESNRQNCFGNASIY